MSKDYDDYQNLKSQSMESEKEDTEFLGFLRKIEYPNPPNSIVEKAIASYEKDYKYRILWRTIKLKLIEYKEDLFGTRGGLEIALASTLILFILSGIVYYKYTKPENSPTNIIANKESPAIKLNPSSTPTPVITPSPVETISPNIAKSPEKNINNENTAKYQQNRNKRNTQIQPNKSIPENNSIDNKDNEQEETAIIQIQPNKSIPENNSIDNKDNQQDDITTVTRGNNAALATMKNIYISNFIEKDLRNALKEVLKANGFSVFENLANANTSIDGQLEYSLPETNSVILSINNKSVFEKFLSRSSAKEEAQVIVSNLIEAIEKAKEAIEKSKTEQKQK